MLISAHVEIQKFWLFDIEQSGYMIFLSFLAWLLLPLTLFLATFWVFFGVFACGTICPPRNLYEEEQGVMENESDEEVQIVMNCYEDS